MRSYFQFVVRPALCTLLVTATFAASAQQIVISDLSGGRKFPSVITFAQGVDPSAVPEILTKELGWPGANGFAPLRGPINDGLGLTHQRYQQLHGGVPVFGATVVLHLKNGQVASMNGELLAVEPYSAAPAKLTKEQAVSAAVAHVGAEKYMWGSDDMEAFIKREQQDPSATFYPQPELVYFPMDLPVLSGALRPAYVMDVYAMQPRSRQTVVIDAVSGEALASFDRLHTIDEQGTAQTAYSGQQTITTFRPSTSANYELRDLTRGGGIVTYDCFATDDYSGAQVPTQATNNWDYSNVTANAILDAHWGTERTYDYYHNHHNWNSFDNNDSPILSYVHFDLIAYGYSSNNNAFWDGERMTYGDGDGSAYNPLTAIDVIGHEISHGVTEFTAGLVYEDEPGALNESFSDIFGACIEYDAGPDAFSWALGDAMSLDGTPLRSMSDPNLYNDPDTYHGQNWEFSSFDHGGVHTNSGVQNFWFYLLSDGGTGTNDNGDSYSVQGIGIEDAGAIAFRNLTVYLNENSQYLDARAGSIQAALDLFGDCSDQVIAVTNAWYAVGVGEVYNAAVLAGFNASANHGCMVPTTIQFNNTSVNGTSFEWHFGDGATSTATSPAHEYTQMGSYTVSLIATGVALCGTTDTIVMAQPIVIENIAGPINPSCQPASPEPTATAGIFRFRMGTIDRAGTGATAGYEDLTCEVVAEFTEGNSYTLIVDLHTQGRVALWIDFNNDGALSASELVYNSSSNAMTHTVQVIIPAGTVFDTPLRMRVIADTVPINTSCTIANGQAQDYTVRIIDNIAPPIAAFTATPLQVLVGATVSFQDISLNVPTARTWAFEGGDPVSSTVMAPQVTYDALGDYDVQLIVSNAFGSDTILVPDHIHVVNAFNLCDVTETQASSGIFYDSGGPSGVYGSQEDCTLLINPPCATSISVVFTAFSVESGYDFLRFYDGDNPGAQLIGSYSGSNLPSTISTTGGELFVQWSSDYSVTYPGFIVEWNATGPCPLFTHVQENACLGSINFTNATTNDVGVWHWDFGDGTSSEEENPLHTYSASGMYTVTLTVGSGTQSNQTSSEVQVSIFEASFTNSATDANGTVDFVSTTPDATSWNWDLGDGGTANTEQFSHTYAQFGSYNVTLTVGGGQDCFATDSALVAFVSVGLNEHELTGISILPNPNQGKFIVRCGAVPNGSRYQVVDGMGRRVTGQELLKTGDNTIDISELANGVYLLKLQLGDGERTYRICKQ